jgi:hypothetical protein
MVLEKCNSRWKPYYQESDEGKSHVWRKKLKRLANGRQGLQITVDYDHENTEEWEDVMVHPLHESSEQVDHRLRELQGVGDG